MMWWPKTRAEPPAERVLPRSVEFVGRLEMLPDRQAAGPPPAGPNNRLPSASAFENGLWLTEDRISIELVPQDRLIETDLPETIRTVPILLLSDGTGRIGRAEIGENIFQGFAALERELGSMFTDPDLPFDQVKLDVDPKLHYSEVVRLTLFKMLAGGS
jgi:hypothetical protein